MKLDFTFLKEDQILGYDALEVMKRYGTKVAPTDLTVILGGFTTGRDDRTSEGDLTCASWSASSYAYQCLHCVDFEGYMYLDNPRNRIISARPALSPQEAFKIKPNKEWTDNEGIRHCEFGEYPQTIADKDISERLESLYQNQLQSESELLPKTGKNYTFDSVYFKSYDTSFKATSFSEYEMNGKRYIRVPGRPADGDSVLSTGEQVESGKPYWVEVQPIEWLMDPSGTMVAKKCLFAGIQFDTQKKYDGDFSKTSMKHYLDTYFAKEMEPLERTTVKENVTENGDKTDNRITALKIKMLRPVARENVSPIKGVTKPKRSPEEKAVIKAALDSMRIDSK